MAARIALAVCILLAASPRPSHAQSSRATAVTGLRPTEGDYGATDLHRLPEAQRLRDALDEAIREVSGRPILNHAALRAALGSSYLVELFECQSDVKCIARAVASVRDRAPVGVYGDYAVRGKKFLFRLRLIQLETGDLVAEHEFAIPEGELEDRERWKREVGVLWAAVETAEASGGGADGGDGGDGGGDGDGDGGDGDGDGGDTGEDGADAGGDGAELDDSAFGDSDELSDADFGVEITDAVVRPVERRRDARWFDLAPQVGLGARWFDFENAPGMADARPSSLKTGWSLRAGGALELYPLAWRGKGTLVESFGLVGEYTETVADDTAGSDQRLFVGALARIAIGPSDSLPTLRLSAGYYRRLVEAPTTSELPDARYRAGAVGLDVLVPLAGPRVALRGEFRYIAVGDAGEIATGDRYGDAEVGGLEAGGGILVRPFANMYARVSGSYSRFAFQFDGNGALSGPGAVGARDRLVTAVFIAGLVL